VIVMKDDEMEKQRTKNKEKGTKPQEDELSL
jgi:hypothetical protein